MNREDIIRMGQEVYLCDKEGRDDNSIIIVGHLEKFAALVASAEREACAMIADELVGQDLEHNFSALIAHNIRARDKHD